MWLIVQASLMSVSDPEPKVAGLLEPYILYYILYSLVPSTQGLKKLKQL